jgi:deoxyribodipyrimidine photo-lyase
MVTAVALFTRDLRVRDNPVLDAATSGTEAVVPLFVFDRTMLERTAHGRSNRFGFLCQSLIDLDSSLRDRGGRLVVRRGDWVQEVVQAAYEARATRVHLARDVSQYAQRRELELRTALDAARVELVLHDAVTAVPPDAFGKPYVVFTPYSKRWLAHPHRELARLPRKVSVPAALSSANIPDASPPGEWVGGETAALACLKSWTTRGLARYDAQRDDLACEGTSRMAPYLHFGCISPLDMVRRLSARDDAAPYVRQLCWREFFAQLLWWRPEVAHADVRPAGAPRWRDDPEDLAVWKEGRTGYPLVDAGMRQLHAEGWMPNRVRMVVASFLTKDLRIDWREGAAHFMQLLVDGDVANNQLNWQWVAGTGTDTNPQRVLNPTLQQQRHDPGGVYVHRWIPELDSPAYPAPIVDHKHAIERWRAARA